MTYAGWALFTLGMAIILWASLIGMQGDRPFKSEGIGVTSIAGLSLGSTLSICGAIFLAVGKLSNSIVGLGIFENDQSPDETLEVGDELEGTTTEELERRLAELKFFGTMPDR